MAITSGVTLDTTAFHNDPAAWFASQAQPNVTFFLAHADDGVIWGEVRDGELVLAAEAFHEIKHIQVLLRAATLQQARLFGPAGELRVWRTSNGFTACLIQDGDTPLEQIIPECQWLWGDKSEGEANGFTLLREGQQGMLHAPPITGLGANQRVALQVKHFIEFDDDGQARIRLSRLAGLKKVGGEE